jgi:hypothetical protein
MALLTNTTAAPALNGQAAKVTLSASEAITYLSTLTLGQAATVTSSSKTGTICEIDVDGLSFLVRPASDAARFDSTTTPAVLAVSETITV